MVSYILYQKEKKDKNLEKGELSRKEELSVSEGVRIVNPLFPPSPRSRLVKNVADTKLVKYLAKCQRFSIGSLRKTTDELYYFY